MEADSPKEEEAMRTQGSKLFLLVVFTLLLSSQAMAAWDVFSPESPPGVAASATCLINGPCSMNSDIYMNGYTIHNVSIANLVVTYDWDGINNIPEGFADNVDNDTTYTADEFYINLIGTQFVLNEGALNNTITTLVESGDVDLNWNYLINVPPNLDTDRTDDLIDTTNFGGDVSGTYDNIDIDANVIGDSEIDFSQVTVADFTNDAGYITGVNWTDVGNIPAGFADNVDNDTTYENLSEFNNDVGYLTDATLNASLNGTVDQFITDLWVNETGDTMTGDLNMSNNSIMNVWELNVHNITGNSPVYVDDELIVQDRVVAKGDIVLANPNTTAFVGERFEGNSFTFVNPTTNETLMQVSDTNYPLFGDDLGDITARTMTIDRLIITGLLNYSNTEPPDYYFSDEEWIYKTNTNGTTFTFNFNGTLLDDYTAQSILNATINWTQLDDLPSTLDLDWTDDVMLNTTFGGDVSGTYDNLQLIADVIGDAEINYTAVTVGDFFNDAQYINFYTFNDTTNALNQSIINLGNDIYNTLNNLNTSLTNYIISVDNETNLRIDALNLSTTNEFNNVYNDISNLNTSLQGDINNLEQDIANNYYNNTESDTRYVEVAGDTMTGSLVINGNLTIIGDYVNATVETQYLDGDFIPSMNGLWDIGANTAYWDTVYAENLIGLLDWSNLTNIPADLDLAASDDVLLTTNHGGDVSGTYDNLQLGSDVVGDNEIDYATVTVSDFTNDANYVNTSQLGDVNTSLSNDITNLENYVNTQNHSGDVVGPYNDLQLQTDVVNDNELNYSDVTLADFTNDDGYVQYGDEIYIYKDNSLSDTVKFNETKLNQTVYLLTGIFEETINITVTGGVGTGVTVECCTMANEILDVRVTPPTVTSAYRFSANSTITGEPVDVDRNQHVGEWHVAHRGVVVTDENINYFITNANTDGVYSVRVRYER